MMTVRECGLGWSKRCCHPHFRSGGVWQVDQKHHPPQEDFFVLTLRLGRQLRDSAEVEEVQLHKEGFVVWKGEKLALCSDSSKWRSREIFVAHKRLKELDECYTAKYCAKMVWKLVNGINRQKAEKFSYPQELLDVNLLHRHYGLYCICLKGLRREKVEGKQLEKCKEESNLQNFLSE